MQITNCYKCDEETEAFVGQVHPLCDECDTDFMSWMNSQIRMIENA